MIAIGIKNVQLFMIKYNQSRVVLGSWLQMVSNSTWASFHDLKLTCPSVDYIKGFVVFNVRGDKYRVVAEVDYRTGQVRILSVLTHEDYDAWCASIR